VTTFGGKNKEEIRLSVMTLLEKTYKTFKISKEQALELMIYSLIEDLAEERVKQDDA
jgi:hypothetical protein